MDLNRFKSNWFYFWGHTCYHISNWSFWHDDKDSSEIDERTLHFRVWGFFFDKYQYYIGVKSNDYGDSELYHWQIKYYS